MKQALVMAVTLTALLTGCEDRENPVAKAEPSSVQHWLMKLESKVMQRCAVLWQAPDQASAEALKACEPEKQRIADAMNHGGFSNQEVLPEDLELNAIWMTYTAKLSERMTHKEKYKEMNERSRENVKKLLPHLRNQ